MRTAVLLATLAACSPAAKSRDVDDAEARKLLLDRNWIERMPETERDHFHVYRFVPSMGGGVFQDRTVFKGQFELFQFSTDGATIDYHFPHDGLRRRVRYTIEHVDGPEPFDLKLTIQGDPRGPGTYWGMTSDHLTDLDALLAGD